jgi:CMP-N-acetylneuraminic acid synthetase
MNIVALICARGGSKGVPGKNIRSLGGRPLITWAIAQARAVQRVDRVIVSTDSPEIAAVARAAGAEVPFMRPAELAGDTSAEWLVWRHALTQLAASGPMPDALLVVPATAPLRTPEDLDRCLDAYMLGAVDTVITVTDAHRNPYFNMVRTTDDGYAALVIPPDGEIVRRQEAPRIRDMTTVGYVARPTFVLQHEGIFAGRVRPVHVPLERALDIDTPLDFQIAEWVVASRAHAAENVEP